MTSQISLQQPPGKKLLALVRASYVAKGTSLQGWCENNGVNRQYARDALEGRRNGPKARALRQRLIDAAA